MHGLLPSVNHHMVCDNITLLFRFVSVSFTERSNHLKRQSILSVCLTAFWQNGGETIA